MNSIEEFAGFDDTEAPEDEEEEIATFKQLVSTDRANLITQIMPLSEFITACLTNSIAVLVTHILLNLKQGTYLSFKKN